MLKFNKFLSYMLHQLNYKIFRLLLAISILFLIFYIQPTTYKRGVRQKVVGSFSNFSAERKYVTLPFTAMSLNGGIGNLLFEAFAVIGIAKKLDRTAFHNLEDGNSMGRFKFLHKTLPNLRDYLVSIPTDTNRSTTYHLSPPCCQYFFNSSLKNVDAKFLIIRHSYFQSFKYFENILPIIFQVLKPDDISRKAAIDRVKVENRLKFKTCVHVRRGDFLNDNTHEGTNATFARNAIQYLNREKENGMFLIFSNDPKWVEEHITNHIGNMDIEIMKTPGDRAIEDLYFSQIWCDSFLITAPSSTFGWWLSYLSKNQKKVYYRDIFETNDRVKEQIKLTDFYPPEWRMLGMKSDGRIIFKNN